MTCFCAAVSVQKRKPHSRHQRVRRKITQFYGFHRELMGADQWAETAFRPTMDPMRVVIKTNRHNVAGSLKKIMPTSTVPTAPMPVHTAYAVPSGSVCVALTSKAMLAVRHTRKLPYHQNASMPVDAFALPRLVVKPTSNKPAITKIIQFIRNRVKMMMQISSIEQTKLFTNDKKCYLISARIRLNVTWLIPRYEAI